MASCKTDFLCTLSLGGVSLYCDTFRTSERNTDIVLFIDVVLYIFLATLQKNVRENWSEMDPSEQLGKVR